MRHLVFIFALAIFGSACATHRPTPTAAEIRQKCNEAEALEGELAILTRGLDKIENELAPDPGLYPLDAQARSLDRRIAIARKAKAAVLEEYEFMKKNGYVRGF